MALLTWNTIALASTLLVANLFDIVSIPILYDANLFTHISVYTIFVLFSFLTTAWYVATILGYSRKTEHAKHVTWVEDTQYTEGVTTSISFVCFALADMTELLSYVCSPAIVIFSKIVLSFLAFTTSFFGLIVSIVSRQLHLMKIAAQLDANKKMNNLALIQESTSATQNRDLSLLITFFLWFTVDVSELLHFDEDTKGYGVYVFVSTLVLCFILSSILTIFLNYKMDAAAALLSKTESKIER